MRTGNQRYAILSIVLFFAAGLILLQFVNVKRYSIIKNKSINYGGIMKVKSIIMDNAAIDRALKRMAHEIIEQDKGLENIYLVGIRTRGVPMAQRIQGYLKEIENVEIPVGLLDITLYRDDLTTISHQPVIKGSEINFELEDPSYFI